MHLQDDYTASEPAAGFETMHLVNAIKPPTGSQMLRYEALPDTETALYDYVSVTQQLSGISLLAS